MSADHPNLCVVGDPDQSIYRWRGADIRNILDFERDFPDARVITLEQNYRSTKAILRAADALIDHNKQRKKKSLVTENEPGAPVRVITFDNGIDEAEGIAARIKEAATAGTFAYRDYAVFMRINALTRSLESAFVKHGIPFQIVKGLAFFERKENKDVLAYLRLAGQSARRPSLPSRRQRAGPRHRQGLARSPPGVRDRPGDQPARCGWTGCADHRHQRQGVHGAPRVPPHR